MSHWAGSLWEDHDIEYKQLLFEATLQEVIDCNKNFQDLGRGLGESPIQSTGDEQFAAGFSTKYEVLM